MVDQPQEIFAQHHPFLRRRQPEGLDLRQLDSRMQPRPVGPEEDFFRPRPSNGLIEQIESPHARGVGINVRMPRQVIDQCKLRPPVVSETAQVRDNEWHVGKLLGQQFDRRDLACNVVHDRQ